MNFLLAITALPRDKRQDLRKIIHITNRTTGLVQQLSDTGQEWSSTASTSFSDRTQIYSQCLFSLLIRFSCLHKHIPVILAKVSGQSAQLCIAVDKMASTWSLSTGEKRQKYRNEGEDCPTLSITLKASVLHWSKRWFPVLLPIWKFLKWFTEVPQTPAVGNLAFSSHFQSLLCPTSKIPAPPQHCPQDLRSLHFPSLLNLAPWGISPHWALLSSS